MAGKCQENALPQKEKSRSFHGLFVSGKQNQPNLVPLKGPADLGWVLQDLACRNS